MRYALTPGSGPLALDRASGAMAVEPRGFNTTHELISAVTYAKAPEFVRMAQLLLGEKAFNLALDDYHTGFAYANAKTDDWLACMAARMPTPGNGAGGLAAPLDFDRFARGWLRRTGYPTVTVDSVTHDAKAKTLTIALTQSGFEELPLPPATGAADDDAAAAAVAREPWIIPLDYAVVRAPRPGVTAPDAAAKVRAPGPVSLRSSECEWSFKRKGRSTHTVEERLASHSSQFRVRMEVKKRSGGRDHRE